VSTAVLVTGGTGFLGRHLVRALRTRGRRVRVLVRSPARRPTADLEQAGAELVPGDLLDAESVRAAVDGADTVFHLAGRLLQPGVPDADYERLHVEGTKTLLAACRASAVRAVVHCSTTGVLGPTGPAPAAEDAPARPSNVYERTKAEGERVALEAFRRDGVPVAVARPALVYGPGDLHLLAWFHAIDAGLYRVVGRGDNLLHPVFVGDVVEGLLQCAEQPRTRGRVYHLVGAQPVAIRDLAACIAGALGRSLPRVHLPASIASAAAAVLESLPGVPPSRLPITRSRVSFMTESRAYCGCRARDELGFVPLVDLRTGLERTVAWYRSEGLL
jgi:nucleoside-diphosphate-sugar epimerase